MTQLNVSTTQTHNTQRLDDRSNEVVDPCALHHDLVE